MFTTAFYEVSAQLIPVAFLGLVVEERLRDTSEETVFDRVARSWVITLLIFCEGLCLAVVAGGIKNTAGVGKIIALSLLIAGGLAACGALSREMSAERSRRERLGHISAAVSVLLAMTIATICVAV